MINQDYYRDKDITVVGLGRSGFACAQLLDGLGAHVSVTESSNNEQTAAYARELPSKILQELGNHTLGFIKGRDLIVTSPGINFQSQPLIWARGQGIPVISEIECAWVLCPATVIAITGTNGKTTTTTLIGKVLEAAGRRAFTLGNIGTPFSAYVNKMQAEDFVSLEVSSFQLEAIDTFKPKISVILNFSLDHLDRYPDLSDYLAAKSRIFMNQDNSDYLLLNYDDSRVRDLGRNCEPKVIYFNLRQYPNQNFAAVAAVASVLGIDRDLCLNIFNSFKGLPHRLERITEFKEREFINDSKATNLDATEFALHNIKKPVILIAGGRDKGSDYRIIQELVYKKTRALILIGEAKDKIRQVFNARLPIREADNLKDAVKLAFGESREGDCILLSPMCSSFDMFSNYEHRGEVFRQAVKSLIESSG
ncbi:MAG: Mur ligase family protein [Candidatus Omnitrophota bacterium]